MIPLLLLVASFQDTGALDRSVAAFTGRTIGEDGGARAAVDARLRLAICPTVAISWRTDAHDAVVVSCTGPQWRVFVPVRSATSVTGATTATVREVVAAPTIVVRRGDPVMIEAGSNGAEGGFQITRDGIAAGDAVAGARVAVRVQGTALPVQAVALANGRVTLPGWAGENP